LFWYLVPDYTTQDLAGPDSNVLVNIYNNNVLVLESQNTAKEPDYYY
jgi:hypothetical protein